MVKNLLENNRVISKIKTTGILIFPVVFYFMPKEIFENDQTICVFKNIIGTKCIGCGITRSIYWTMHFDFKRAYELNKLILIIFPMLTFIWFKMVIKKQKKTHRTTYSMSKNKKIFKYFQLAN